MPEYIDREALMVALCEEIVGDGDYYSGKDAMQDQIRDMVSQFPQADVAPVRHGQWEWFEEWDPGTQDHPRECQDFGWRCGECKTALEDVVGGYWDDSYEEPKLKFCPNCGAKMDEEETT